MTAYPSAPAAALREWNDAEARSITCQHGYPNWCRQCSNNCYNYGTDIRTDTFAQPGWGSGKTITSYDCDQISRYAFYDGLTYTPAANNLCPSAGLLVALVIAPGLDFHWYRLNSDGYWAHKPGVDPATDLDDDGRRSLIRVLARAGLTRSSVVS